MKEQFVRLAAVGCSLPLVSAGGFKWNSNHGHDLGSYVPAHETGDLQMHLQPTAANPEPTSPPELKRSKVPVAERRDASVPGSVCGYMSHDLDSTLACAFDNTCLFTTFGDTWVAGCCPTTSTDCAVATTCVNSDIGEAMTEIGISTRWCSSASFPICVTLEYEDVPGYTIYNCGGTEVITSQAIDHSLNPETLTSSSSSSTGTSTSSTSTSASGSSTKTSTSGSTSTPAASTTSAKSSTPIGAIVGGVVGGVAVIALLILGIIFIRRNGNKKNSNPPPAGGQGPPPSAGDPSAAATYANQQPPPPQMHQQAGAPPPFAAAGHQDPRYSIQKHPHDVNTQSVYAPTLSSPGSPPPLAHSPSPGPTGGGGGDQAGYPSPPLPPHGHGHGPWPGESTFQPHQQQQQNNGGATHASQGQAPQYSPGYYEMPATRHDGELRELP